MQSSQQTYRKHFILSIVGILLVNLLFFSGLYIYDPLQIFHKNNSGQTRLHRNMREQAAGIINNYEFDSVILGTSMLENTDAQWISEAFDLSKTINISISGSDFRTRGIVLDYMLKNKKINSVFYGVDYVVDISSYRFETSYLYDDNRVNDFKAYLNQKYLTCYLTWSSDDKCLGFNTNLSRPNAWYQRKAVRQNFGGKEVWVKQYEHYQVKRAINKIIKVSEGIEMNKINLQDNEKEERNRKYILDTLYNDLFRFAELYPDTDFYLIFPPYSRALYATWAQWDTLLFDRHLMILRYVVKESQRYSNVKVYGFETKEFLDNFENYRDLSHYDEPINQRMSKWIREGEGELTVKNIDEYIFKISSFAKSYNLREDANYFKAKLGDKLDFR